MEILFFEMNKPKIFIPITLLHYIVPPFFLEAFGWETWNMHPDWLQTSDKTMLKMLLWNFKF